MKRGEHGSRDGMKWIEFMCVKWKARAVLVNVREKNKNSIFRSEFEPENCMHEEERREYRKKKITKWKFLSFILLSFHNHQQSVSLLNCWLLSESKSVLCVLRMRINMLLLPFVSRKLTLNFVAFIILLLLFNVYSERAEQRQWNFSSC